MNMNIQECINRVDSVKPNQYSIEDKVRWLSYLDGSIQKEIFDRYEQPPEEKETKIIIIYGDSEETESNEEEAKEFTGYSPDRLSDALLVPFPYDELYVAYLKAKIDDENGETARYNNSASTFNGMLQEFQKAYHRDHMPKSVPFHIL
jgi:hypothetical protein